MIRLRPSGVDEILIKRVQDWYEPGPGVFIQSLTASFSPAMLFTGSTTGAWYDPSDITTLYQDAAGTTPVTAVEQPVGRMLDKSGRGNHAFNPSGNTANFPVLSAKYNLLTKTEDQTNAVWVKAPNVSVSPVPTIAPNGTLTAYTITATSNELRFSVSLTSGVAHRASISIKKTTGATVFPMVVLNSTNFGQVILNTNTGIASVRTGIPGATNLLVDNQGDFWRLSFTHTPASSANEFSIYPAVSLDGTSVTAGLTGSCTVWGADLRVANDALNQPAYQRVNTSSDYDTAGFKRGEVFDGINDYLTASAGGGSTTSFFWCSAIRSGKVGAVQTLFSDAGTNTGYRVRINASNQLELSAGNGTAYTAVSTTATLSIGQRSVLTAWHDGINLNVQINNGTVHQVAFSTATAGTAQFTIGKDNNAASNFFAGWLYEKVYTKDNVPSSAQIADTKAYVANIAGITL